MPYITREDGEHFVIPSYRDVLVVKQKSSLKKEILALSQNYGEYITLQRKATNQYEVAFSSETGYLLGESIWHYFKRPLDFIYCEALPNSTEAIVVIVKAGSVYLDGSFPIDSIPEELVIFLTQQNNFEIYIYGAVPISQSPEEGKFSFEPNSIKTFTVLDKPIFPTLPLVKTYQLQLVDQVLRAHGIGVFPFKEIMGIIGLVVLGYFLYSLVEIEKPEIIPTTPQVNPYQGYLDKLMSPPPDQIINEFLENVYLLATIPGWRINTITYSRGQLLAKMVSAGSEIENLSSWADNHHVKFEIRNDGIYLSKTFELRVRPIPDKIYPINAVVARFIDDLAKVYPGNRANLGPFVQSGPFTVIPVTITVSNATPMILVLIAKQLENLPFSLDKMNMTYESGSLSGSINLEALGN